MKNANTPAMPLSGDAYNDFAAFDGTNKSSYNPECQGLTKREMFAMHAMNAWIQHHGSDGGYGFSEKECAKLSVECADALLAELEK
jgi:hypothetical protein